jgi:putative cardiolipin synthase
LTIHFLTDLHLCSALESYVMKSWYRPLVCGALILELASCRSSKPNAVALPHLDFASQETIAQACRLHTVRRRGTSGFEMLPDGCESFLARLAMVEAAQRTLDLQYYIWKDDVAGTTFADRLLAAADRGVRIRLLLDSANDAQVEVSSEALAAHPNIQVAFFNPLDDLKGIFAGNPIPVIGDIDLGDAYFGIQRRHNLRDLDFIATGPVVDAAAKSFELFWRSPLTYVGNPEKITGRERAKLRGLRKHIARKKRALASQSGRPYPLALSRTEAL